MTAEAFIHDAVRTPRGKGKTSVGEQGAVIACTAANAAGSLRAPLADAVAS